jgi:hypothetical protein
MNDKKLLKITGHPLILFGEKPGNSKQRCSILKFFFQKIFSEKNKKFFKKKNIFKQSFFKMESRKKNFQTKKTNKEIFLSKRIERHCLFYKTNKNIEVKRELVIGNSFSNYIYELIKRFYLKYHSACFQSGDGGLFSLRKPGQIDLYDFKKNKIVFTAYSKLYMVHYLSPHPIFPSCFLTGNYKCSEFWKVSSNGSMTTLEFLYHKDLICFQKYRKKGKIIDFGTLSMKWKCFDEVAQKYIFSRQFNETITDISTSEDNNLSAISTYSKILIFDHRIRKIISNVKRKTKNYSSLEWLVDNPKLIVQGKEINIWNTEQSKDSNFNDLESTQNNKWNINTNSSFINLERRKNLLLTFGKTNNNFFQSIISKKTVNSWIQNESNTMIALNIDNEIFLFNKR